MTSLIRVDKGFVKRIAEGTAGVIANGTADAIAGQITEGEDCNGFANSEGCSGSKGSVGGRGSHSIGTGSAGRAKGEAAAESRGCSTVSGDGRSVSRGENMDLIKDCNWCSDPSHCVALS